MSNSGKFTVLVYADWACVGDIQGPGLVPHVWPSTIPTCYLFHIHLSTVLKTCITLGRKSGGTLDSI